jgi:hypothetical protein
MGRVQCEPHGSYLATIPYFQPNYNFISIIHYSIHKYIFDMVLKSNTKQQNMFIWCIMDTPNHLLEPPQMVMQNNPYVISYHNG